jgi:hypothetical protein
MSTSYSDVAAPRAPVSPLLGAALPDTGTLGEACVEFTRRVREAVAADDPDGMSFDELRGLLAAVCEFYASDVNQRGAITPVNTLEGASATAVLMLTTGLLRGANLELFELGMWQTWSGLK